MSRSPHASIAPPDTHKPIREDVPCARPQRRKPHSNLASRYGCPRGAGEASPPRRERQSPRAQPRGVALPAPNTVATHLVTLHPAAIITRGQELIAERRGRLARAGGQNDETVPNALCTEIDGLRLGTPSAQ